MGSLLQVTCLTFWVSVVTEQLGPIEVEGDLDESSYKIIHRYNLNRKNMKFIINTTLPFIDAIRINYYLASPSKMTNKSQSYFSVRKYWEFREPNLNLQVNDVFTYQVFMRTQNQTFYRAGKLIVKRLIRQNGFQKTSPNPNGTPISLREHFLANCANRGFNESKCLARWSNGGNEKDQNFWWRTEASGLQTTVDPGIDTDLTTLIVAACCGGLVVLICLAIGLFICLRKDSRKMKRSRRRKRGQNSSAMDSSVDEIPSDTQLRRYVVHPEEHVVNNAERVIVVHHHYHGTDYERYHEIHQNDVDNYINIDGRSLPTHHHCTSQSNENRAENSTSHTEDVTDNPTHARNNSNEEIHSTDSLHRTLSYVQGGSSGSSVPRTLRTNKHDAFKNRPLPIPPEVEPDS